MRICLGDPILRKRLEEQMKREKELRRLYYLNPSASTSVRRVERRGGCFQKNTVKQVKSVRPQLGMYSMEDLWPKKNSSGGGKVKSSRAWTVKRSTVRL